MLVHQTWATRHLWFMIDRHIPVLWCSNRETYSGLVRQLHLKMKTMSHWKPSQGRITLMPEGLGFGTNIAPNDIFAQVWGGRPDSFQKNQNPLAPSVAQGTRGEFSLTCSIQPTRIDFVLTRAIPSDSDSGPFPLIESTTNMFAQLDSVISGISKLEEFGRIARVAASVHFIQIAESFADANSYLGGVLPENYGPQTIDGEDFILQVNHPSQTSVGLQLNGIIKWSVDRVRVVKLVVNRVGGSANPEQLDVLAATVTFDYNTMPKVGGLRRKEQAILLTEALTRMRAEATMLALTSDRMANV